MFEQQSESPAQLAPATAQRAPPHVPPLHASEQQSWAAEHFAPSGTQYPRHTVAPLSPVGSQRELQHVLRVAQAEPGEVQAP
jgi:hypothetical protein